MSGMTGKRHSEEAKAKMRLAKLGKHMSPATQFKEGDRTRLGMPGLKGESNPKWNPRPTYSGIHQWISRMLGKPKLCWDCGFTSENGRQFHWANISGEYKRDTTDWVRLCASCHFRMDRIHEKGWITRRAGV